MSVEHVAIGFILKFSKMMMGGVVPNLDQGCSEDDGKYSTDKRPTRIGHFHGNIGSTHLAKVAPLLDLLPIPYVSVLTWHCLEDHHTQDERLNVAGWRVSRM
jgi:hypothetical protein